MLLLKKLNNCQLFRFFLTGALNTTMGYIIYVIAYYFTKNETYALITDYILSILFNFKSYSLFVFNTKNNSKIFRFTAIYVLIFLLNRGSLYLYIDIFGLGPYISQLIALTYIPLLLFFLFKNYVFIESDKSIHILDPSKLEQKLRV